MNVISCEAQMSESFRVGALLAFSGGILDAYTYICRGGVFANAQTGNIVLVGINAAKGNWTGAMSAMIPVLAFITGIVVTALMRKKLRTEGPHVLHWRHMMLVFEMGLMAAIVFFPIGWMDHLVNIIVSFVCSMQVQTFKKIHGHPFATTMCTGNLRSGTEALCAYIGTGDSEEKLRYLYSYGVIMFFVMGAVAGAAFSFNLPLFTIPLAIMIYIIAFIMMIKWDSLKRDPSDDR